jgi:tetratricopeptide (TPR) repeat protein
MLRMLRRAATLAAVCLIMSGLVFPQSLCTFMGKVIGTDGKPMLGAVIKIERKDIKGNWKTKTNKKGEWLYSGMPFPGSFKVTCEIDGKLVDAMDNVRSALGDPVTIDFDLFKGAQRSKEMAAAAETGTLTKEQARDMSPAQKAALEKSVKDRQASMAKNKALQDSFNTGMTALTAKEFPAAVEALTKATELAPKEFAVWANLAAAHEGLAKTKTGAEADAELGKAGEAYAKALEIKPDDAGVHNNNGLLFVKLKKVEEAKAEIVKAATLDPAGAGKYYFNLGAIMVNTGQNDAALDAFQKAVAADPNYANAWYYIGNVLSGKMTMDKDGKPLPPPGMQEALEKYLALQPTGQFADAAKGLLSVVSTTIETKYVNPDAKKAPSKKKK